MVIKIIVKIKWVFHLIKQSVKFDSLCVVVQVNHEDIQDSFMRLLTVICSLG